MSRFPSYVMAGLDPAIQGGLFPSVVLPWMAASEGGHDVQRDVSHSSTTIIAAEA